MTGPTAAGLVLAAFWLLMLGSLRYKSVTFDEIGGVTAGYTYWRFDDYRMDPENGNLPQRVMAIPLLWGGFRFPDIGTDAWRTSHVWQMGDQWFHEMGNDVSAMLARGRAASGLLAVALGALVWLWARRLFGPAGGFLALILFVFSPTILANGALMTSDTASSLFFLASVMCLWRALQRLSPGRLVLSGIVMGGLAVSKMSAVLIVPIALILALARVIDGRPLPVGSGNPPRQLIGRARQTLAIVAAAALHVVIVVAVIWASYGFRYSAFSMASPAGDRFYTSFESNLAGRDASPVPRALRFINRHQLLPQAFIHGCAGTWQSGQVRYAFMNGQFGKFGWKSFFPYTFLVKTPLPVFGVILLAILGTWAKWRAIEARESMPLYRQALRALYTTLPLWALLAVYWTAAIFSHIDIGHRHIMPTYAPMFILCGAAAAGIGGRMGAFLNAILAGLVVFLAAEILYRFPNYIAYFNSAAGGPANGYRRLVDSSLDWGQDLPGVKRYIEKHQLSGPVYLSYFGMARPDYYKIRASYLFPLVRPLQVLAVARDTAAAQLDELVRAHPDFEVATTAVQSDREIAVLIKKPAELRLTGGTYFISASMLQPVSYGPHGPCGPWNARYEEKYQELYRRAKPFLSDDRAVRRAASGERGVYEWMATLNDFDGYHFARLTAFLREREPDDTVSDSILIYRLSDSDLARALEGPPPKFGPDTLNIALGP